MGFVHLHCHTQYSLLDGAIRIDDLIRSTVEFAQDAVAITDHGVMYGAMEFHDKARAAGIRPVLGCEVYVAPGDMDNKTPVSGEPRYYHLVLLAKNNQGYQNLMRLVSLSNIKGFYHKPRVDKKILQDLNQGLIAMSACLQGEIPYWLLRDNPERAQGALEFYRSTFDSRFYLEIQENNLSDQDRVNPMIVDLGKQFDVPIVATNDCHYLHRSDAGAHEALLCIQTQKTIHDKDRMRFATDQLYLKSPEEMASSFSWIPEAVEMTGEVASQCEVEIPKGLYYFPVLPDVKETPPEELINSRAKKGLDARLEGKVTDEYAARLSSELEIIISMGFPDYFLIVADYIQYAKNNDIPVGPGRGSAAGSLVAYALGITDMDPIRWNLFFERFLNPERKSMPDIDVDFCQARRDEVIEYVKNTYGADYVGQITTFGNMKAKAVVRDVGRVLGMSYAEVDRIAKLIPNDLNMTLKRAIDEEPRLREIIEKNNEVARLKDIAISLEGLSRHASVHAGGVVISDDKPLMDHVPVYVDKKGMLISQYDKKYVERVGLIKFDMLGLKTLTVIHKAVEILHARGVDVDISNLDLDDPEVYSLIGDGDTACVFQLESSGMRQMLRQLKPSKFEDIIAAVALYRPGPMAVIPSYIARKGGREKIEYLHPSLEAILRETYGIIVYQEQVMQIAQVMGGYSLGKADLLRRAMGKKIKKEMAKHRQIFVDGATQKGISEKISSEVFALMEKFAEYGFNKSHAAAYALVSFQTAYLKAHHFNEFMAANLTLDLNDSDKVVKHIAECKAKDVPILSPDINESSWEFVPTPNGIRFGLTAIKNVGQGAVDAILQERQKNGGFKGIEDLIQRVALSKVNRRVIEAMIRVGVFDTLHPTRRALMDVLEGMMARAQRMSRNRQSAQASLFSLEEFEEEENREMEIPDMPDWDNDERLRMEKEGMGFYVSGHPLKRHMGVVKKYTTANTRDIADNTGNVIIAGMLNGLNIMRTRSGETMAKAEIEDLEGSVPVIFFPRTFGQNQEIITSETPVVIRADIKYSVASDAEGETEKEYPELIAQEVYPIDKAREVLSARILVSIKESATISGIVALKDAVSAFKGTCVLSFEVKTQGVVVNIDAGSSYMVDPTKDLVERIKGFSIVNGVEVQ